MTKLKVKNWRGWETLVNKAVAIAPYFSSTLRSRVHMKQATNVVVSGEAGEGKSLIAIDICRALEGLTRTGNDRFKLDQVVFNYQKYLDLVIKLPMGKPIVFDEPSYAMGKRDWYKDLNKALVLTIESQRFKVHPLFIPIINKSLLDKTIRSYLIQFQVEIRSRGHAVVYRIYPSQHVDKVYRYTHCQLRYEMFDSDLCDRDSCLDCKKILECNLFRARYERKKASIQDKRYAGARDMAQRRATLRLTDSQIENILFPLHAEFTGADGKLDATLMRIVAEEKCGIRMGNNRAYKIVKGLRYHHSEKFPD